MLIRYRTPVLTGLTFSPINALKTRQETIRIDHDFNDNHRLFGRYTHDLNLTQEPGGLFANTNLPNLTTTDTRIPGQTLAISLTDVSVANTRQRSDLQLFIKPDRLSGCRTQPPV